MKGGAPGGQDATAHPRALLRAPRGEGVLEAEEVEEGELGVAIAVGLRVGGGEEVLEAEEVGEGEFAASIAVGAAGLVVACPGGEVGGDLATDALEAAADGEVAGGED